MTHDYSHQAFDPTWRPAGFVVVWTVLVLCGLLSTMYGAANEAFIPIRCRDLAELPAIDRNNAIYGEFWCSDEPTPYSTAVEEWNERVTRHRHIRRGVTALAVLLVLFVLAKYCHVLFIRRGQWRDQFTMAGLSAMVFALPVVFVLNRTESLWLPRPVLAAKAAAHRNAVSSVEALTRRYQATWRRGP